MKSCCGNFSKYLLDFLNLILFFFGITILATKLHGEFSVYYLVIGSSFIFLDIVSWWAAFNEHRCMLITLAIFESALFVAIIVLLVLMNKNKESGETQSGKTGDFDEILAAAAGIQLVRVGLESFMASVIRAERNRI